MGITMILVHLDIATVIVVVVIIVYVIATAIIQGAQINAIVIHQVGA